MLLMASVFAATVFENYPLATPVVSSPLTAGVPVGPVKAVFMVTNLASAGSVRRLSVGLPDWVACLWLLGLSALSMYTASGWIRVQRLKLRGTEALNPAWAENL